MVSEGGEAREGGLWQQRGFGWSGGAGAGRGVLVFSTRSFPFARLSARSKPTAGARARGRAGKSATSKLQWTPATIPPPSPPPPPPPHPPPPRHSSPLTHQLAPRLQILVRHGKPALLGDVETIQV